jgi:nitrogen fixation/metabolism regulation signal transduction histidine kinase
MTRNRKKFWVHPPLQVQMMIVVMSLIAASLALVSFSVFAGLQEAAARSRQAFHSLDWFIAAMRGPLILSLLISILSSVLIVLAWSHRFAGPLRVLSAAFQRLAHGNFAVTVRIRRMDTHQDLVSEFASMQDSLKKMIEDDRKAAADAAESLRRVCSRLPQSQADTAQIEKALAELKGIGSKYQL